MAIQSAREPIRRHLTTHDFRGMGEAGLLSEDDRIELRKVSKITFPFLVICVSLPE